MAAQQGIYLNPDNKKTTCVICRGVLKDPVSIPCGHCFCLGCIKGVWDGEDRKKTYSCPQCRQTFTPRPVLVKSTIFVDFMETFKKTGLHQGAASPPADFCCYAGPEDVACDVCTGRKLKALKSCLMCKASYCEKHLKPHYESPLYAQHKLLDPSKKLLENLYFRHTTRTKRVFSGTHQEFVGYLYYVDRHKAPDKVAAERTERQKELEGRGKPSSGKFWTKRKVKVLQLEVVAINGCADKAVEDSEKTFNEMICLFQKKSSDLKQQLRAKQETEVGRVKDLQGKLEKEIADLRRTDAELKTLSVDNSDFLQKKTSLSCLNESPESHSSDTTSPLGYFEDMTATLSELREKLHGILNKGFPKSSPPNAPEMESVLVAPQPETRSEFLQYSCQLILDPNTVHTHLLLSEGNRKVTLVKKDQLYPWHPDRFLERWQVLSNEGLTGRCYWEVERSGVEVFIAVAYKDISRTGTFDACAFGNNAKSWGLASYRNGYHFKHGNIKASVTGTWSSRVGVYLDQSAGILSFYSVSESTMTLLHKVQAVFTQPLYAGFRLPNTKGDAVELCSLE